MAIIEGASGAQNVSDGTNTKFRATKQGSMTTSVLHAPGYEDTYRGNGFVIDSDSVTLAAANATKGAAGTIKLINGFYNPVGSGVNAVIEQGKVHTESGTPAGGFYWNHLDVSNGVGITNVPTGTVRNRLIGGRASKMSPMVGVVITRGDSGTGAFAQTAVLGGPTAIAATGAVEDAMDVVNGKIIVPPGVVFGITAKGAGTSHVVQSSLYFTEVPV